MNRARTLCRNTNCLSTTYKKKVKGSLSKRDYMLYGIVTCQGCGLDQPLDERKKYTIIEYDKRAYKLGKKEEVK